MRHVPRTGAASNTFVPLARSTIGGTVTTVTRPRTMPARGDRRPRRRLLAPAPRGAPARLRRRRRRGRRGARGRGRARRPRAEGPAHHAGRAASCTRRGRGVETGSEVEAAVERAYQRFLDLNRELIRVCNDWQVRPGGVAERPPDPTYDWSVIDRLVAIDDRVGPILRTTAQHVTAVRRATGPGCAHARERVARGRARVAHVAAHRLVPHRVDAAARGPAARARRRPRVRGVSAERAVARGASRVVGRDQASSRSARRAGRRRAGR